MINQPLGPEIITRLTHEMDDLYGVEMNRGVGLAEEKDEEKVVTGEGKVEKVASESKSDLEVNNVEAGTEVPMAKLQRPSLPAIHINDAAQHWWSEFKDFDADVEARLNDFVDQFRLRPEKSAIVVGHSLFFR